MTEEDQLDKLLQYYKDMVHDHDTDLSKLNTICKELFVTDTKASAFRIYRNRLIADGFIWEDVDEDGNKRWMASHKGLGHSYEEKRKRESIQANLQLASTWAISVGTLLAGCYALFQLFEVFSKNCCY